MGFLKQQRIEVKTEHWNFTWRSGGTGNFPAYPWAHSCLAVLVPLGVPILGVSIR